MKIKTFNDFIDNLTIRIQKMIDEKGFQFYRNINASACLVAPVNAKGVSYRGGNALTLLMSQHENKYLSNRWLTFKQVQEAGGKVLKGAKSQVVYYFSQYDKKSEMLDANGEAKTEKVAFIKFYHVFNVCETTLADNDDQQLVINNADLDATIQALNPSVRHIENAQPYYSPCDDIITMPHKKYFATESDYYATLCHELSHWTGHEARLDRESLKKYRIPTQKKIEEITAEITNAFLMANFSIDGMVRSHETYIVMFAKNTDSDEFKTAVKNSAKAISFILSATDQKQHQQ